MQSVNASAQSSVDNSRSLLLTFQCPQCRQTSRQLLVGGAAHCAACGWSGGGEVDLTAAGPARCLICSCNDLWRRKDFSQPVGLLIVGTGIVLSTGAYALWEPTWALAILMMSALLDALLFFWMRDVLVCYRCGARYGGFEPAAHRTFDLEVAERYRQERLRLQALERHPS
jgi:hypothetical protein